MTPTTALGLSIRLSMFELRETGDRDISLHLLEEGHNHPIVRFAYLCHMIGEDLDFLIPLVSQAF